MARPVNIEDGDPQSDVEMYELPMPSLGQIFTGYRVGSALWKAGKVAVKHPAAGAAGFTLYLHGMMWAADNTIPAISGVHRDGVASSEFLNAQVWGL